MSGLYRDVLDAWLCPICGEAEPTKHHAYVHLVEAHPLPPLPDEEPARPSTDPPAEEEA